MLSKRLVFAFALGALFAAAPAMAQGKGKGKGKGAPDGQRPVAAQQDQAGPGGPADGPRHGRGPARGIRDDLMETLYPVELVREFGAEIGLTDAQIEKLRKIVSDVRAEIEQLEWDLERENRKLVELVRKGASKEDVYAQLDVMFTYENKIKKKHLGLLIVVRDVLTPQQRAELDKIKAEGRQMRGRGRGGRPDHGPGGPGGFGPGGPGGPGMAPPPPPPGAPVGF